MKTKSFSPRFWIVCGALAFGLTLSTLPTLAQDLSQGGYSLLESQKQLDNSAANPDQSNSGPVRMARFAYLSGEVTWRGDDSMDWAAAKTNLPLKQGAQISVMNGGRAEIQFDDGSYLRLGGGAVATLITLYSDTQGEFTEIKLTNGLAMLRLNNAPSVYQLDTPLVSVKTSGPARVRLGLNDGVEVGVLYGQAVVEGAQGKATLKQGDYLDLRDENSHYDLRALPSPDSWERWNEDRDRALDEAADSATRHQVPQDITLVSGDLDAYGTWRDDPDYGYVWCPRVVDLDWRPYYYGNWVWVNPFGWTWCSAEPWGWAPYHYGTWFHARYGWAWCPGPAHQFWSPAVVHFSERRGEIAWAPLAPGEVRYPATLGIGFRGADWTGFFSIGVVGNYYPPTSGTGVFAGRVWNNTYVNHTSYVNPLDPLHGPADFVTNHNTYLENRTYVPINARSAAGVTVATQSEFAGKQAYRPLPAGIVTPFSEGHGIAAPVAGQPPVAGPQSVRPNVAALTPNRTFVRSAADTPSANYRPVYRAQVSAEIARTSSSFARPGTTSPGQGTPSGSNVGATTAAAGHPNTGATESDRTHALSSSTGSGATPSGGATRSSAAEAAARARASIGWTGGQSGDASGRSSSFGSGRSYDGNTYSGRTYGGSSYSGRTYGGSSYNSGGYSSGGYSSRSYDGNSYSGRTYGGSSYNSGSAASGSSWHTYEGGSTSGRPATGASPSAGGSRTGGGGGGTSHSGGR